MEKNLNKLLEKLKESEPVEYSEVLENINFLRVERIKLTTNDLRTFAGMEEDGIDKEKIMKIIKRFNMLFEKNKIDFIIPEEWETVDQLLRLWILDDIQKEIKNQT